MTKIGGSIIEIANAKGSVIEQIASEVGTQPSSFNNPTIKW